MKSSRVVLFALAALAFAGCSTVSLEQAEITRSFKGGETEVMLAIAEAVGAVGFAKINPYEFTRVERTKHDPILGLVEVSKDMDQGLTLKFKVEPKGSGCIVTCQPASVVRLPLTKAQYHSTPVKPGSRVHAEIVALMEKAKARTDL